MVVVMKIDIDCLNNRITYLICIHPTEKWLFYFIYQIVEIVEVKWMNWKPIHAHPKTALFWCSPMHLSQKLCHFSQNCLHCCCHPLPSPLQCFPCAEYGTKPTHPTAFMQISTYISCIMLQVFIETNLLSWTHWFGCYLGGDTPA